MQTEYRDTSLLAIYAECSLSSAKIMQMSAMKACFQIAECSLSSAKIMQKNERFLSFNHFYVLILS